MDNGYTPSGSITARIIDYEAGMKVLQNIRGIRIQSKEYGLLIMEDYMPTLGKVEGKIVFLTRDDEVTYENVTGFYKHQYNEFTILMETKEIEEAEEEVEEVEEAEENEDGGLRWG